MRSLSWDRFKSFLRKDSHTVPSDSNEARPSQPSGPAAPVDKAQPSNQVVPPKMIADPNAFFTESNEAERYTVNEVIGKGSYGVVCSATDTMTNQKVAIKKIINVFDHVSDSTRILREIKLLRLLKHPDIVEIKHIMLPSDPRQYKDIFVVFELMETDLHQVIKANDDLTADHHQFFLYQLLRGLKFVHSARVFHRDLKPKNILANSDCKLKICDFGLARPAIDNMPTTIYWTDYVATRWYRAPELCGSFFARYSPAIDIWSVGCIFAEILLGKPLFPGRNVVQQLELITDLLGSPSDEVVQKVRNEKAKRFLLNMARKPGVPFEKFFPKADPGALNLLRRMLAFDPSERPSAVEALQDPYFLGLANANREPSAHPVSRMAFDFERRKLTVDEVRDLIYREILEFHPQAKERFLAQQAATQQQQQMLSYPSGADSFRRMHQQPESTSSAYRGHVAPPGAAAGVSRARIMGDPKLAQPGAPGSIGGPSLGYGTSVNAIGNSMRHMQVSDTR